MIDKDYRKLPRMSFSYVKDFDKDRIAFYKKHILGDRSGDEVMSTAMQLGTVVDCLLFSPNEFDDRITVASCLAPTGQMGDFTTKLVEITIQSLDEDNVVTRDIKEMMEEAFNAVKYNRKGEEVAFKKKDFAYLCANFLGSDAELYYKTCRSQFGKVVVDLNLLDAAKKTKEDLETCEWTKDIIGAKSIPVGMIGDLSTKEPFETIYSLEVIDQLPLLFEVDGELFKGMPDRVIIDHLAKTITPYDLKISYTGEDFQYQYWKMKYYLQVASYYLGLHWYKTHDRPELAEYEIPGIEFIVGSSTLNSNPLLFSTNSLNINEGLYGFVTKSGQKYKGLYELVEEINWHKKNQLWRNSKEVYDQKGKMIIRPFKEVEE